MPTFKLGMINNGNYVHIYDRERTVCDFFRKRRQLGEDIVLSVFQKKMQGNLYIAPIDIYNEYNPADRFKDNDFVYYTVHEDAVVSVNGNILEAVEPPDGIDLRDKKLYILNNYCTGSPIIVDIDYGYVQLQDWVTIGIIERTGSDDAIFVFTNRGPV